MMGHKFSEGVTQCQNKVLQVRNRMNSLVCVCYLLSSVQSLSRVRLFVTPWIATRLSCVQLFATPWSISRQEYWIGLPFPFPGDLPDPGIKPQSPTLQADSLPSEPPAMAYTTVFTSLFVGLKCPNLSSHGYFVTCELC